MGLFQQVRAPELQGGQRNLWTERHLSRLCRQRHRTLNHILGRLDFVNLVSMAAGVVRGESITVQLQRIMDIPALSQKLRRGLMWLMV